MVSTPLRSSSTASAASSPDGELQLRYNLPRFNLYFDFKPGSAKLYSWNHSGYYLASSETLAQAVGNVHPRMPQFTQLPLPLMFENFIVLVADDVTLPVKVLIPDASTASVRALAGAGATRGGLLDDRTVTAQITTHCYHFHPYTTHLETNVMASRLYLAALHAASSCALPLPGLGMTGGEHALQLLRQCWVNEPLESAGSEKLIALTSVAMHTPTLQLNCVRLHAASESLSFLYSKPDPASEAHSKWLNANLPELPAVNHAYQQEQQRPSCFPVQCSRRLLLQDEAHELLAPANCLSPVQQRPGRRSVVIKSTVRWAELKKLPSWQKARCHRAVQIGSLDEYFHKDATDGLTLEEAEGATDVEIDRSKADLQILGNSRHEQLIAEHCIASLEAHGESGADSRIQKGCLPDLQAGLQRLQKELQKSMGHLANFLLEALAYSPTIGTHGTALRVYQAVALASKPALADLIPLDKLHCPTDSFRCDLRCDFYHSIFSVELNSTAWHTVLSSTVMQEFNPLLTADACCKLVQKCQLWQEHCVLLDKIERCLQLLSAACDSSHSQSARSLAVDTVSAELRNRRKWDYAEHPQWLASRCFRSRQYTVARQLLDNLGVSGLDPEDRGAVLQVPYLL